MKENVLEVLLFIFEHFYDDETGLSKEDTDLVETLEQCGFGRGEVEKALVWLDGLLELREHHQAPCTHHTKAFRVYTDFEKQRLSVDCQGFILFMEHMGVLDPQTREMVIDRAIALEAPDVEIEQLKWVVMMVLYNMPDKESEYTWLENLDADLQIH
ncbi:MAG: DUF494 domain-containing protein [Enterobacterales bacterium]|nr:DUF494 domain-containing protein [Enterobacterales bacterium]